MFDSRYSSAVCLVGDYVYVFGGKKTEEEVISTCEK
jgi:hypothetical protein